MLDLKVPAALGTSLICLTLFALAQVGCAKDSQGEEVTTSGTGYYGKRLHRVPDDKYKVVCWVYKSHYAGGVACLPESALELR